MTAAKFENERASDPDPLRKDRQRSAVREWNFRRHSSISTFDNGQYTYYRYDLDCPNGDVITTLTNVTNVFQAGKSLYGDADDRIVRRILSSIRCRE